VQVSPFFTRLLKVPVRAAAHLRPHEHLDGKLSVAMESVTAKMITSMGMTCQHSITSLRLIHSTTEHARSPKLVRNVRSIGRQNKRTASGRGG
jgi:hypothetical protein